MAQQVIDKIEECLKNKKSFIMLGGAGSGKTHTLMLTIDRAVKKAGASKICCVTYTNAAVDEIKRRCPYEKLKVGTIHDTLWDLISPYQKNLVVIFRELINNNIIKIDEEEKKKKALEVVEIQYREFRSLEAGIFSHDDLLEIAKATFEKYPLLLKIFADKYKFFFVDEYQDTFSVLVDICIQSSAKYGVTVGFFGDTMQSIYENYLGTKSIETIVKEAGFVEIKKEDNYRCATTVIDLINRIRTDGIIQKPATNNMVGKITFLYSMQEKAISEIKESNAFHDWKWDEKTKQLFLTHKLISKELGFERYLTAFSHFGMNSNSLAIGKKETERHKLANYLFQISRIIDAYQRKDYGEVLRYCYKPIKKLDDKQKISEAMEDAVKCIDDPCLEMVDKLVNAGVLKISNDALSSDKEKDKTLLDNLQNVSFKEVLEAYKYSENLTPFSTQHNIKGLEFENIFVYLDNARWNQYNFTKLFSNVNTTDSDKRICERTLKLVYVCFSRAKVNLVVYFPIPNKAVLEKAKSWFAAENVIELQ